MQGNLDTRIRVSDLRGEQESPAWHPHDRGERRLVEPVPEPGVKDLAVVQVDAGFVLACRQRQTPGLLGLTEELKQVGQPNFGLMRNFALQVHEPSGSEIWGLL